MAHSCDSRSDPTSGRRAVVAELVVGYVLILAVIAGMFLFATGIDVTLPWPVLAGVAAVGAGLIACAARRR